MSLSNLLDIIKRKKRAYSAVFFCEKTADGLTEDGAVVVLDLMDVCKPYASIQMIDKNGKTDMFATGIREGQRQVFLHITKQLNLDDGDIINITKRLQNGG